MPVCPRCNREHATEDLVQHQRSGFRIVHCPDCKFILGRYHEHVGRRSP